MELSFDDRCHIMTGFVTSELIGIAKVVKGGFSR